MTTEKIFPDFATVSSRMTGGEKRLYQRLREKCDADTWIWYDQPVGGRSLRPDFTLLHPQKGLLILEVKDWRTDSIFSVDNECLVLSNGQSVKNPLAQARSYLFELVNLLRSDPVLTQTSGNYAGNLVCPFNIGVVFPNLTRAQFDRLGLNQIIPGHKVLCRDEMYETISDMLFEKRLWQMRDHVFPCQLSEKQIDHIRWHLFPEVRVPVQQYDLLETVEEMSHEHRIQVMDIHQTRLAHTLKSGHHVIHGVSGSGKTLILLARARALAEMGLKNILVICFNRTLEAWLRQQLKNYPQVKVFSFFQWCRYQLEQAGYLGGSFETWANRLQHLIDTAQIEAEQYEAILIDEGHDLEPEWIRLLVRMGRFACDGARQELLFLYDDAQDLYGKGETARGITFPLKSVGIQAVGRTTVLKKNYRNTVEILQTASSFLFDGLKHDLETHGEIIIPEAVGISGSAPQLVEVNNSEVKTVVIKQLRQWHEDGMPWEEMAVLLLAKNDAGLIVPAIYEADIPVQTVLAPTERKCFNRHDGKVKIMTAHSAKGLEFEAVSLIGIDRVEQTTGERHAGLVKAAYVAMTRAKRYLQVIRKLP